MNDDLDWATDIEQAERDTAISRVTTRARPKQEATGLCVECGDSVSAARLRILGNEAVRCAHCAYAAEGERLV